MIHDLLAELNALLLQHPHLLQVMQTLFWVKYYGLLGIFGFFAYRAMTDKQLNEAAAIRARTPSPDGTFIA
jgi:hypothetical protein